jgi:phosphohistidine phosphatase
MKTLILVRHAEANASKGNQLDFDRSLSVNGENQAHEMRRHLHAFSSVNILSSSSVRTTETAKILNQDWNQGIAYFKELYNASADEILFCIQSQSTLQNLVIIAHNPGISQLYYELTGDWNAFSPCSFGIIETPVEHWGTLTAEKKLKGIFISPEHHE